MISQHRFKKIIKGYQRDGRNGMRAAVGLKPMPTNVRKVNKVVRIDSRVSR